MRTKVIVIILILVICYFPLFLHLENLALFPFDESRLAINAWEMLDNGNWLVPHFDGKPDMWNTKPPLMIWLQALCMKLFGINELSVRLPAALAALTTLLFIGYFCWKKLRNPRLGLFAIFILVTTPGFVATHMSRTGDYDALLVLFSTIFLLSCFWLTQRSEEKDKTNLLYILSLSLSLAVLTKSIAGLLFVPFAFGYLLYKRQLLNLTKSKHFYFSIALAFLIIGSYYGLREFYNPGYLKAVWENEIGGRYFTILEKRQGPPYFYLKNIWQSKLIPWLFFLPLTILLAKAVRDQLKNLLYFLAFGSLTFLFIISISKSKLEWYDAPIYPLLAIIIAIGIDQIYKGILKMKIKNEKVLLAIFCIAIFGMPYKSIISNVYLPKHKTAMNQYGSFLKRFPEFKNYTMCDLGYNAQIKFYTKKSQKKGASNILEKNFRGLKKKEQVLFCGEMIKDSIDIRYSYDVIKEWETCRLVTISSLQD